MKYDIRAKFVLLADNRQQALEMFAACAQNWDDEHGIEKLQGVGGAEGHVTIQEHP